MKTFYITTPIYYANSLPHLGHLYTTIVADVIHRYKQQRGFDVYFLTGTDEHGINIQRAAEREGRTPQEQVDYISGELKRMFRDFGLDTDSGGYDIFMRTTEPFHYAGVQHLWREIAKNKTPKGNDNIYKGFYEGWFCAPCAEYKTDGEFLLNKSNEFETFSNDLVAELNLARGKGSVTPFIEDYFSYILHRFAAEGININIGFLRGERPLDSEASLSVQEKENLIMLFNKQPVLPAFEILKNYFEKQVPSDNTKSLVDAFRRLDDFVLKNELLVPRCPIHKTPLDLVGEESYFFRLSDYDQFLIDLIENDTGLVRPESRRNEVLSFVRGGLQDLSISRQRTSVAWGVPVPGDENHVMYVWLDALSNYITALGYGNERDGFEKYWPAMHLVGKDILRFHTVYWFSFLKAAGLELPKAVYAHGMWLDADGRKMGKTLGNVIEVDVLHQHFQVDALRYFVLREMVFGQDGKFGYENLIDRANSDLASGLGNLGSRTFSMISKYRDGLIPNGKIAEENYIQARRAGLDPDGGDLVPVLEHARDEFIRRFDNFEFSQALEVLWAVIARIDKMISDAKPWELVKDEKQVDTLNAVLYRATETLRWLAVMLHPVMPQSATNIYGQIGLNDDLSKLDPANLKWGELNAGTAIGETEAVFPRIDKGKVMSEIKKDIPADPFAELNKSTPGDMTKAFTSAAQSLREQSEATSSVPPAVAGGLAEPGARAVTTKATNDEQPTTNEPEFITIDDFTKVELRVGEIKVAERVPKADKLLRFEVDLGEEKPRQILAGLAEYYEPEKLIGRKVVVVANLKPRKMRGLESQGMICAASLTEEDTPAIVTFLEDVKIGARLK